MKRCTSLILAMLMAFSLALPGFGQAGSAGAPNAGCTHAHDANCGYTADDEGKEITPCEHVCCEDCGVMPERENPADVFDSESFSNDKNLGRVLGKDAPAQADSAVTLLADLDVTQKVASLGDILYCKNSDDKLVPYIAGDYLPFDDAVYIPLLKENGDLVTVYDAIRDAYNSHFDGVDEPEILSATVHSANGAGSSGGSGSGIVDAKTSFAYETIAATGKSGYFAVVAGKIFYDYYPSEFEPWHVNGTVIIAQQIGSPLDFGPLTFDIDVLFGYPTADFVIPKAVQAIDVSGLSGPYMMDLEADGESFLFSSDLSAISDLEAAVDCDAKGFSSPVLNAKLIYYNITVNDSYDLKLDLYANIGEANPGRFYIYKIDRDGILIDFDPQFVKILDDNYFILPAGESVRYVIANCMLIGDVGYSSNRVAYVGSPDGKDMYIGDAQGIVRHTLRLPDDLVPGTTVYVPLLREAQRENNSIYHPQQPVTSAEAVKSISIACDFVLGEKQVESIKIVKKASDLFTEAGTAESYFLAVKSRDNDLTGGNDIVLNLRLRKTTGADSEGSLAFAEAVDVAFSIRHPNATGYSISTTKQIFDLRSQKGDRVFTFSSFPKSTFTTDVTGEERLLLWADNAINQTIYSNHPRANLTFFNGNNCKFMKIGTLTLQSANGKYIYERIGDELMIVNATYDSAKKTFTIKTRSLGNYVISDRELDITPAVAPSVTGKSPAGNGVAKNTDTVTLTFNKPMDTAKGNITVNASGGKVVSVSAATWSADGKTISVKLGRLYYSTQYTVSFNGFVSEKQAAALPGSWTFTTADAPVITNPPSKPTGGGGGGGGGNRTTIAPTQVPLAQAPALPLTQAVLDTTFNTALATAPSKGVLALYFKSVGAVSPELAAALNKKAAATGLNTTYCFDTLMPAGGVGIRLYMKPENITKDFSAAGALESADITKVVNHFSRWFKNDFRAFYTGTGSYGGNVQAAVYLDLTGWNTDNIRLYYYNLSTNSYIPIAVQQVRYSEKYLYLTLDHGDYIVVSQGPLERK